MANNSIDQGSISTKQVTPLSRDFVRYLLGFGVSVAVGLAPYLGKLEVPLFTPLLNLIPENVQDTLLPLSAASMGAVAVFVQWYGGERLSKVWLRRAFSRASVIAVIAFLMLLVVHTFFVVRVPILGGTEAVNFLVGINRPIKPPCPSDVSDAECIKRLTFNTDAIESFWGDRSVRSAKLLLMLPYLTFTCAFASLVGLVLLRDRLSRRNRR